MSSDEHDQDAAAEADETETAAEDQQGGAEQTRDFEDLPLVRRTREMLAERGYNENDPMRVYVDVAAEFAAECKRLTNRQSTLFAAVNDTLGELRDEIANLSVRLEEIQQSNDEVGEHHVALMGTFEKVLTLCAQFTPFLEKAAREIVVAAGLIENRSTKAMILSYLSPAIALCTGFILAMLLK